MTGDPPGGCPHRAEGDSARMERMYGTWLDSAGYLQECDEHGSQRAAFLAGFKAGRSGLIVQTTPNPHGGTLGRTA